MRKIVVLLVLINLISFVGIGQISFFKTFTNNGYDYGQGIVQLEDSSYVITGSSSSFTEGPAQAFLLKIDSLGNYLWSHHYGGSESELGRRVLYKKNFGFFIAGYTNSFGNGAYDFYLGKTDENGSLEWEKSYGGTGWEKINHAALTRDTGTLLIGQSNSLNGDNDIYIVRTNKVGDTLWTKRIGGSGEDYGNSVRQMNDSTFIIAGEIYVEDSLMSKGFVMKLTDDGVVHWMDTLGANGNYSINDIEINFVENKVSFVGWRYNNVDSRENPFFGKVTLSGIQDSEYTENSPGPKIWDLITKYGTPNKIYVGFRYIDGSSFQDAFDFAIGRFTSDFWWDNASIIVNHLQEDVGGQLIPTSDGGAVVVGHSSYDGTGGSNVFVMKIGPNDLFPSVDDTPFPLVNIEKKEVNIPFSIYPNPANTTINIKTNNFENLTLSLIDMEGREMIKTDFYNSMEFNVDSFASGVYFLTVQSQNTGLMSTKKIIIE